MIPQTDKSWRDYTALNQNWSYQPTLAGLAIFTPTKRTMPPEKVLYVFLPLIAGKTIRDATSRSNLNSWRFQKIPNKEAGTSFIFNDDKNTNTKPQVLTSLNSLST